MEKIDWVRSLNPNKYKRPIRMLTGGGVEMDVNTPVTAASSNGMGTAVLEVPTPEKGGLPIPIKDPREVVLEEVNKLTHRVNLGLVKDLPSC